nr:MAG TPA: HTH-type transcriptional regulator [Caudoviricetes sp.]
MQKYCKTHCHENYEGWRCPKCRRLWIIDKLLFISAKLASERFVNNLIFALYMPIFSITEFIFEKNSSSKAAKTKK